MDIFKLQTKSLKLTKIINKKTKPKFLETHLAENARDTGACLL